MNRYDLVIIGMGASGMLSSIIVKKKNKGLNILILEKNDEPGKKLSVTGNGRCNITNTNFYNFPIIEETFKNLGIDFSIEDERRCYPKKDADFVVSTLKGEIENLNINYRLNSKVVDLIKAEDGFIVVLENEKVFAKNVCMATGGKSYPKLGTTGDGYVILRNLGLKIETLIPSLTKVTVKEDLIKYKGIRQKAKVSLYENGILIDEEIGEVQFRDDSLSGICIMNLSTEIVKENDYEITMDFKGFERNMKIDSDTLTFHVTGLLGWKDAQVTKGGLSVEEINLDTFESRIKNLYVLGELINIQGKCGGYNLSYAWDSAIKFGENFEI